MLGHPPNATDLQFVTLKKSEARFSPATRCRDLALGPSLFRWESQSTTTAASATGQRTIHHVARGSRVLLYRCAKAFGYVREQRRLDGRFGGVTEPFRCLGWWLRHAGLRAGSASYESHEAARLLRSSRRAADGDTVAAGA